MGRPQAHRLEVSVSIAAASTVAALLVLAGLVQGQACDATQLAAWGNAASVNSACANNSACDCDPRVGNLSSYTEDLLPSGCVSSYPDPRICQGTFHNSGSDPCKPPDSSLSSGILLNQMVYIKDPENFCILLPNDQSKYLTHWYYGGNGNSNPPSIVQAEGFVQSFCAGSYMPSKSRAMPSGGVRSAHVVVNFTTTGARFIQISGTMDCGVLNINCQQSSPGAYDDGGQSGDGIYCMRVCEGPDSSYDLGDPLGGHARTLAPCDSSQDTQGCEFWNANTGDGFDLVDVVAGTTTTYSVSLPPVTSTTSKAASATGASATVTSAAGTASAGATASSTKSGAGGGRLWGAGVDGAAVWVVAMAVGTVLLAI
ncbi:hypothetical protein DFJ73DRAFT_960097 [Zopfochytrium polystomum]|nr:hypothetical protein DFJ73DRAFT_960097 [Zopfochytrium polystomum]